MIWALAAACGLTGFIAGVLFASMILTARHEEERRHAIAKHEVEYLRLTPISGIERG